MSSSLFDSRGYFVSGGAAGYVAYNAHTNEVAIVFRGTDPNPDVGDLFSDLALLLSELPAEVLSLQPLIDGLFNFVSGLPAPSVYATGHSLGGAIAELVWSQIDTLFDGGLAIGSPGVSALGAGPDSDFLHVTRTVDYIGEYNLALHQGLRVEIHDDNFSGSGIFAQHSDALYAFQLGMLGASGVLDGLSMTYPVQVRWLNNSGGAWSFTQTIGYDVVFGGDGTDNFNGAQGSPTRGVRFDGGLGNDIVSGTPYADYLGGNTGADTISGGAGNDSLFGGTGVDTIDGGAGDDNIEGGTGNDTLIGGGDNDRYSIGVGQGYDIIDDQGTGADRLVLSTGSVTATFNSAWLHIDGNDLLIQIPNPGGGLAFDIRIRNMATSPIERLEIWAGDGASQTTWFDLSQYWSQHHGTATPDEPSITDISGTPSTSAPVTFTYTGDSGNNSYFGTSGADVERGLGGVDALGGGGGDDKITGNGGTDILSGDSGNDLLIDDDAGSLNSDTLSGGDGNDSLVFYGAPSGQTDHGHGNAGNDLLFVDLRSSNDDWNLHHQNDTFTITPDDAPDGGDIVADDIETVAIFFGSGDDFANGEEGQFYFDGGGGDDQLTGGDDADHISGGSGDDHLDDGGGGEDWLDGGSGTDRADIDLSSESRDITFLAAEAATTDGFTFENGTHIISIERIDLTTGSGDDRIWLSDLNFDDFVVTGGGDDLVTTNGHGKDSIDAGSGEDRLVVDFSWSSTRVGSSSGSSGVTYYVGSSSASAQHRVSAQNFEHYDITGTSLSDVLRGAAGGDALTGGGGDDLLHGFAGDDILNGGAGDDTIDLGEGVDWADGGSGRDNGSLDRGDSTLSFTFNAFLAATSAGLLLEDGTYIRNIEIWSADFGSGNDTVTTDINGQTIFSFGGGVDRLIVDHRGSNVALTTYFDQTPQWFEIYDGASFDGATNRILSYGVELATIYGGNAGDTLMGLSGGDQFTGGGGNDSIDGARGVDTANYAGSSSAASWHRNMNGSWTITSGSEGTDTLTNVEVVHFANRDIVLDNAQQNFYGNGASDILWRNINDGQVAVWEMNGSAQTSALVIGSGAAPWTIVNTGDFSGDGRDDILWRNTSDGQIVAWRDASWQTASFYGAVSPSWVIAGVGDFNFDGRDDFLWRNTSDGLVGIWLLNGATSLNQGVIGAAPLNWSIVGVADFDGDGRDDILWRQDTGLVARWTTNGTAQTDAAVIGNMSTAWVVAGTGDFDGDARADILWRNTTTGAVQIWRMDGATHDTGNPGGAPLAWQIADVGDYNGDGRDDILWRNVDGTIAIWTMNGFSASAEIVGGVPTEWGVI